MDILDDMAVSKLSAEVFLKVNCSFNTPMPGEWFVLWIILMSLIQRLFALYS